MKIDLSVNGKLDNNHLDIYRKFYSETKDVYVKLIEDVSSRNIKNTSWWFSAPSSRHIDSSHIHHYLASLLFLEHISKSYNELEIIVETNEYKKIIEKYFKHKKIKKIFVKNNVLINKVKNIFKILLILIENISYLIISSILKKKSKIDSELNLIHYDIHSDSDINHDRYFHFNKHILSIEKWNDIKYVILPRYVDFNILKYIKFINKINISKNRCLLFESVLSLTDYIYIFYKSIFPRKIIINNYKDFKYDISNLIIEEIKILKSPRPTFNAYAYSRFVKKLSKKSTISRMILWYENYIPEKGLLLGLNKYSSNTLSKGYQGFAPQNYLLNLFITNNEKKAKLTPNIISYISRKNINFINQYVTEQKYEIAPALRYEEVFKQIKIQDSSDVKQCFIYAPYDKEETIDILKLVIKFNKDNRSNRNKIIFNIKFHPGGPIKFVNIYKSIIGDSNINLINSLSNVTLSNCDLVITGPSSVCFESIAMGKYVMIYDRRIGSFRNIIASDVSNNLYCIFNNFNDLNNNLNNFIGNKNKVSEAEKKKIRLEYFEEVNKSGLRNFFYF